ncbi:YhgE/Pip domain-containing protein [Enterococcus cecorum]|uniref:YhgE/Pip domain-containing protein n=1 Tax=Enterococcus cecorum TaxID=44008 RepID=UPI001FACC161|nr:YhgE/Pip domain-containing protein [Enterococcus cecorum]MCJ0575669.1 YhgE/Pip domain-containing protein [Enterococcus cecorum]
MIKKEFQKIWANKLLFATVIVAMCLPILYASIFLKSIWDPYGRVNHLPVAVVNLDQPTTLEGNKVDVGDKLVKELKSNDDLDWHFVSAKKAQEGLKDRKYYMIVKIPKNFSENAASVLDTDPEKMDLTYETNGGLNFLGEVISENAMTQLKAKVSESVTKSYADVIIKMVKTVGDGMEQAADGATKLADGSKQVADGIATVQGKVPELSSGVKQLDDGGKQLADGVKQYTDGAGQAAKGSDQLAAGMTQLSSNVPTLLAGGKQLADGTNLLYNQLGAASMTADQREGLIKYINGVRSLKSTLQSLQGLMPIAEKVDLSGVDFTTINDLANKLGNIDFSTIQGAITPELINQLQNVTPLITQVTQQLQSVGANLQAIQNGYADAAKTDATNDVKGAVQATVGVLQQAGITDPAIYNQVQTQITNAIMSNAQNSQVTNLVVGNLKNAGKTLNAVKEEANGLTSLAPQLEKINKEVVPIVKQLQPLLTKENIGKVQQAAAELKPLMNPEVIESVNKVVNNPASKEQLKQLPEFINSTDVATAGLEQTVNGIYAISSNYGQVKKLNDGMQTMNKSLPTLAAGVKQLDDGSKQLNAGMKELTANSAKLNSGASQLSDGLNTLNGQIPALADGVNKLADGSTQVKDGNKELADKLGEASDKLTDVKLTNNTAKMIADPTKTKQEKYSDVPNYGHALAPYFMSVSLFVGCLVFNFVYPIRKIADRKNSNATQWFMSKLTIGFITSSMMALIIGTVMRMIGLEVAQPMNFYMTLLVTAWLFMFMIMFLAMSFDNPGRFIAVLLLVMQLGSSGGVFPMPLISKFYNVLNPFMPMTYSIYSLRQAISTGLGDEFYRNSMLILVILAIVFIILLGISMQILYRKGLAGYSQLHENQKLLDDDYTGKFAKEEDPYTLW